MSKRSDFILLQDILEAIKNIDAFTDKMDYNEFSKDNKTNLAVLYSLTVIGEASNKLSTKFTLKYNQYDWRIVVAFRNRIVHDYAGVDFNLVWEVITKHLTELKNYTTSILEKRDL